MTITTKGMLHDAMRITGPTSIKDLLWRWVLYHEGGVKPISVYYDGNVYMRFGGE